MEIKKQFLILILLLMLIGLAGCAKTTQAPSPTQAAQVSEEAAPTETLPQDPTDLPEPTQEPTEAPTEVPTEEPTEEPVAEPVADGENHCLYCHTDQQMLIDTAKPVEAVESENEGAG